MNRINRVFATLWAVILVVGISSCNKSKLAALKYIPQNATTVFEINFMSLHEKLVADGVNTDSLYKTLNKDFNSSETLKEAYDYSKPVFIFYKITNSITEGNQLLMATVMPLSDVSKAETYFKNKFPDKSIQKGTGFSYIQQSDDEISGWNNNTLIKLRTKGASAGQLMDLFNLKKEKSLAANKNAEKALSAKGDICYFVNSSQSLNNIPYIGITKASDLLDNMYAYGIINFNKGAIDIESDQSFNATLTDLIKKNKTADLSGNTLASFPGKPQGLFDVSINLKQLVGILDYVGFKNTADEYLKKTGSSLDDLTSAFTGEIALAFSNLNVPNKNISAIGAGQSLPSANFVFTMPIANKAAYDRLINVCANMGIFVSYNGMMVPKVLATPNPSVYFNANDKALTLASTAGLMDSFVNNKGKIIYPDELNIKNKTALFYLDLQNIFTNIPASGTDSLQILLAKNTFKSVTGSADNMKGNIATANLSIKFMDGSKNSLTEILNFVSAFKKISKDSPADFGNMDTNIPPPPNVDTTVK